MKHWDYGWGMGFVWIFMIFFPGAGCLWDRLSHQDYHDRHKKRNSGDTALEIINKRYSKGEITKEKFDKTKNDLKAG